jgi:energy-coupling factor transporter transmembrane protein EcfT
MRTTWHVVLGSGRGVVTGLAPQTRLVCAAAVLAVCLVAPVTTVPGLAAVIATVLAWLALCGPPAAPVRGALVLGLVLLSPVLLLTPLVRVETAGGGWVAAAAAPWSVFAHGLSGMLVTTTAATTLSASALRQGLVRLPVPKIVVLILLQVVQQTSTLLAETGRVAAAMAVRGGGLGANTVLGLLTSIPKVWLPRVITRADRVAAAMELRGIGGIELEAMGAVPSTVTDALAIGAALLVLASAALLRLWGPG